MGAADHLRRKKIVQEQDIQMAVVIGYDDGLLEPFQIVPAGHVDSTEQLHERAQQDQV
jgi:hypothetical protein